MPIPNLVEIARTMPGGWYLHGQCRLVYDAPNLRLIPDRGNYLIVDDRPREVPSAGLPLSPSGLIPNTNYYIYATVDDAGNLTSLSPSTTGHATKPGLGVEVRADNPRVSLVGLARTTAEGLWADSFTQRFVLSWFNRRAKTGINTFTTNRSRGNVGIGEVHAEIRVEFLVWQDDVAPSTFNGRVWNDTATGRVTSEIAYDGVDTSNPIVQVTSVAANDVNSVSLQSSGAAVIQAGGSFNEGYHYITLLGSANITGTAFWSGAGTKEPILAVTVQG